ncbi:MAG: hypothetical protein WCV99_06220 [Sterolibacterium sp.]|jgi:hypothetical protein
MWKTKGMVVIAVLALASMVFSAGSKAESSSVNPKRPIECNSYPQVDVSDFDVGGKIGVTGLRKLASGEIDANLRTETKKLLADFPDANKSRVLLTLMSWNCRAIQEEQTSPDEKKKSRERFSAAVIGAYSSSLPRPLALVTKRVSDQRKESWDLPSVRLAAQKFSLAAARFRGALDSTYEAALGGSYLPVLPYELMLDEFMLHSASRQDMMHGMPGVITYPEEAAKSLGFDVCAEIRLGNQTVDKTLALFSSKVPETVFADIEQIKATRLYQYFSAHADRNDCDIFLGKMKLERARATDRSAEPNKLSFVAVPRTPPEFSSQDLKSYLIAVKHFEDDVNAMAKTKADSHIR